MCVVANYVNIVIYNSGADSTGSLMGLWWVIKVIDNGDCNYAVSFPFCRITCDLAASESAVWRAFKVAFSFCYCHQSPVVFGFTLIKSCCVLCSCFGGIAHNTLFTAQSLGCRPCFSCAWWISDLLQVARCSVVFLFVAVSLRLLQLEETGHWKPWDTDRYFSLCLWCSHHCCMLQAFDCKFIFYVAVIVASVLCAIVGDLSLCCRNCVHPRW